MSDTRHSVRTCRCLLPLLLVLLFGPGWLHAQDAQDAGLVYDPFTTPESPAFTYLNVSPSSVERPRTPRTLAIGLANGVDSAGKVRTGLAFDVAPFQFASGIIPVTLATYQKRGVLNWLWNTSASLGTVTPQTDSASTDLSLGFRTVFYDANDEMADPRFTRTITDSIASCQNRLARPGLTGAELAAELAAVNECGAKAWANVYKQWQDAGAGKWNGSGVSAAFALGWRLIDSQFSMMPSTGWAAWLVASKGIGSSSLFMAQLRYDDRQNAPEGAQPERISIGARAIFGSARANGYIDYTGGHTPNQQGSGSTFSHKWSAGIEFRAADQLWLSTGLGSTFATRDQPARIKVIANMRFKVFKDPQFVPR
jgi:hypothetical protein